MQNVRQRPEGKQQRKARSAESLPIHPKPDSMELLGTGDMSAAPNTSSTREADTTLPAITSGGKLAFVAGTPVNFNPEKSRQ